MIALLSVTPKCQGWRSWSYPYQKSLLKLWRVRSSLPISLAMTHGQQSDLKVMLDKHRTQDISLGERKLAGSEPSLEEADKGVLDKSKFDVVLNVLALRIPKQHSSLVSKILTGYLIDRPRIRHIVPDPSNSNTRLIVLSESITNPNLSELPGDRLASLRAVTEVEVVQHHVLLDYSYWPVEHILQGILPAGCEVPSSFETVGHIAHLNIRDELLPYKTIIASVILDKNQPKIKTVVNKVGTIKNEFRVPTLEVLAGDESLVTELKQHSATFRLDYGLVYWNSRLEFEHKRLISQFCPQHVICDMFAGIGPFAIPAAQKRCIVYANDLNPDSVTYLQINADINKVNSRVHTFNMDAREFMLQLMRPKDGNHIQKCQPKPPVTGLCCKGQDKHIQSHTSLADSSPCTVTAHSPADSKKEEKDGTKGKRMQVLSTEMTELKPWKHVDHIIMNLPASALEFLDVFQGLLSRENWKGTMPRLHCYCFMRSHETTKDVIKHAEKVLNGPIKRPDVWVVRDVAPNKTMLCVSFDLPEVVAFQGYTTVDCNVQEESSIVEAALKKARMDR